MSSTTESVSMTRSATETPTVHLERMDEGTIAVLTLDDPKRANAMSPQMGDAFSQHVRSLINDTALRVVIIRGAGKDFSIGGHRDMLISLGDGTRSEKELHDFMLAFYNRWLPVLDLPVPVIVVLQGDCIGVAPVFACAADIAIADETLSLQVTFASLGFYPGMALPELLKRRVGAYNALRLCATNDTLTGREAERLGLVDKCLEAGAFEYALQVAREITSSAPSVVRLLKRNLGVDKSTLVEELELNAAQQAKDFGTEEYRRRVANYLPKHIEQIGVMYMYSGAWVPDMLGTSHSTDHTYHVGPHVMIITPHNEDLEKFSHDGSNGQPYVAHLPGHSELYLVMPFNDFSKQ